MGPFDKFASSWEIFTLCGSFWSVNEIAPFEVAR